MAQPLTLWYEAPAPDWNHALPVGNGRLGTMVFGGTGIERLQLNEETLWDGYPVDAHNPRAREALPEVRRLLFAGENAAAEALCKDALLGEPLAIRSYQSLGDLFVELPGEEEVTKYRRELDLTTGVATTRFVRGGVTHTREVFVSAPDDLLVVRLSVNKPGSLTAAIRLTRGQVGPEGDSRYAPNHTLTLDQATVRDTVKLDGRIERDGKGRRFSVALRARLDGGGIYEGGDTLFVEGADAVTLFLAAGTDWNGRRIDPLRTIDAVLEQPYPELIERHRRDHARLFGRVRLEIEGPDRSGSATDVRLAALREGGDDPGLMALYFQYGRYLLLGSSRPGTLPANLQGVWNEYMQAPWNSNYTTNINAQMNYWPAEVAGLPECHEALFDFVERLATPGAAMARDHYGCRGWVLHHVTDIYGYVAPADGIWGLWPMGAAWLCRHLFEHWRFAPEKMRHLRRVYPLLKGAAEFLLDFTVIGPGGTRTTCPSHSPENRFRTESGAESWFTYGATMDLMIVRECWQNALSAAQLLGRDEGFQTEVEAALAQLQPLQISPRDGRLQEWQEDYDEPEPGHRHISHAYGFYPGETVTLRETPGLAAAFGKSLAGRLAQGGGHTGWSRAWIVNLFARFEDGDAAHEHLRLLLTKSTLPNLFDDHPPFQIDGNFGGCAGIAEMLVQSHAGEIHLLPALPSGWPGGSAEGLRARGGVRIDLSWRDGALTRATLLATTAGVFRVRVRGEELLRDVRLKAGKPFSLL